MSYVDGFVCAVPSANRQAYTEHAEKCADLFQRHGALSLAECWGDDLPEGETNSMHTAVLREPDETVVFSWIVWPSKQVRDEAWEKLSDHPDMSGDVMPFDGGRMIYGGFDRIVER